MATEGIVFLYCSYVCNCAKNPNFKNCRFSFRKLQIFISQTTHSHFANYRFSFRFVSFRSIPFANYSKPSKFTTYLHLSQTLVNPFFRPVRSITYGTKSDTNLNDQRYQSQRCGCCCCTGTENRIFGRKIRIQIFRKETQPNSSVKPLRWMTNAFVLPFEAGISRKWWKMKTPHKETHQYFSVSRGSWFGSLRRAFLQN